MCAESDFHWKRVWSTVSRMQKILTRNTLLCRFGLITAMPQRGAGLHGRTRNRGLKISGGTHPVRAWPDRRHLLVNKPRKETEMRVRSPVAGRGSLEIR